MEAVDLLGGMEHPRAVEVLRKLAEGTFGSDAGELTEWGIRAPETPIGRLKCCGLLVEATVDRVQSVFIPAGLPLDAAWLQETKT